jgi:hypothetical protein
MFYEFDFRANVISYFTAAIYGIAKFLILRNLESIFHD